MLCQLRTYRIKDGEMEDFLALWRDHVVPARAAHGYQVLGAWSDPADGTFVWVVGHEAPEGWEAAEQAYYASPERQAVPRNPYDLMESWETKVLQPV